MSAAVATRYECSLSNIPGNGYAHTSGNGAPKRKRCAHCGGAFMVRHGRWIVTVWRGDGRYPECEAVGSFTSEKRADAMAAADTMGTLVVRWVACDV